jgi:hypothetical protein
MHHSKPSRHRPVYILRRLCPHLRRDTDQYTSWDASARIYKARHQIVARSKRTNPQQLCRGFIDRRDSLLGHTRVRERTRVQLHRNLAIKELIGSLDRCHSDRTAELISHSDIYGTSPSPALRRSMIDPSNCFDFTKRDTGYAVPVNYCRRPGLRWICFSNDPNPNVRVWVRLLLLLLSAKKNPQSARPSHQYIRCGHFIIIEQAIARASITTCPHQN